VPTLIDPEPGCRFADRCPNAFDRCHEATPALVEVEPGRQVRCFLYSDASIDESVPVTFGARS
jgi:oligopeptide/dipeptide ABC transporter ATP-binding protein